MTRFLATIFAMFLSLSAQATTCPNGVDTDGDTIPDACDVCDGHDDRLDWDGDTVPDGCDTCPGYDDYVDDDSDGVPNACDVCPGHDDGLDGDNDGNPDGCDVCGSLPDDLSDDDNDGVPGCLEMCPGHNDAYDANGNGRPDGCDSPGLTEPSPGTVGVWSTLQFTGGDNGDTVYLLFGRNAGTTSVPGCPGEVVDMNNPKMVHQLPADWFGNALFDANIPAQFSGRTIGFQAVAKPSCLVSPLVMWTVP